MVQVEAKIVGLGTARRLEIRPTLQRLGDRHVAGHLSGPVGTGAITVSVNAEGGFPLDQAGLQESGGLVFLSAEHIEGARGDPLDRTAVTREDLTVVDSGEAEHGRAGSVALRTGRPE